MAKTEDILDERGSRYGNYLKQAEISQQLVIAMQDALLDRKKTVAPDQADALKMIAVKISRIINGDPDYADNWRDIAGYATLVAERLEGKTRCLKPPTPSTSCGRRCGRLSRWP